MVNFKRTKISVKQASGWYREKGGAGVSITICGRGWGSLHSGAAIDW